MNVIWSAMAALLLWQSGPAAGATIRGRILDPDGQPMANVEVWAVLMIEERETVGGSALSDVEGRFSIGRIVPGRIILRARPRPPRRVTADVDVTKLLAHPPAYFPGVLERSEAWPIELAAGEIVELDFHMPAVVVGSIKALVTGPDGHALEQVRVMRPEANQIRNVTISADGVGYADGLREGRYVVAARGRWKDARLAAYEIVHIIGGELPVDLRLAPAARIIGRVVTELGGIPPADGLRVVAAWTDGSIDLDPLARDEAPVAPDGSFSIDGVFGRRALRVSGLTDVWQVASIRHGSSDITTSSVECEPGGAIEVLITLSRR
jgi:hypothetical protein